MSDLYGARDYTLRDNQIERVQKGPQAAAYSTWSSPLPMRWAMNQLSQVLDIRLCIELFEQMQVTVDRYGLLC